MATYESKVSGLTTPNLADATASDAGVVELNADFAATGAQHGLAKTGVAADATQQYLIPEIKVAEVTLVNSGPHNWNCVLRFTKIHNVVTMGIYNHTQDNNSNSSSGAGVVPVEFRPYVSSGDRVSNLLSSGGGSTSSLIYELIVFSNGQLTLLCRNYAGTLNATTSINYPTNITYLAES